MLPNFIISNKGHCYCGYTTQSGIILDHFDVEVQKSTLFSINDCVKITYNCTGASNKFIVVRIISDKLVLKVSDCNI